jgi:hypothetical protein
VALLLEKQALPNSKIIAFSDLFVNNIFRSEGCFFCVRMRKKSRVFAGFSCESEKNAEITENKGSAAFL